MSYKMFAKHVLFHVVWLIRIYSSMLCNYADSRLSHLDSSNVSNEMLTRFVIQISSLHYINHVSSFPHSLVPLLTLSFPSFLLLLLLVERAVHCQMTFLVFNTLVKFFFSFLCDVIIESLILNYFYTSRIKTCWIRYFILFEIYSILTSSKD